MTYKSLESALLKYATQPARAWRIVTISALIALPTLFAGFLVDDFMHLLTLRGDDTTATPFDLFCFAPGDAAEFEPFLDDGPLPWYTLPELKLHLFRPLSSATMVLDHALFGEFAVAYHLHSILWYVLLTWSVFLLFRRSMAPGLAGICCLLYIVDDGHIIPALWWSNRNAMVSAAPAILGLVAHMKWREEGWWPGLPLSLAGYCLGLLGGETALGVFGYLIAWECFRSDDTWLVRVRALTGGGVLAVGYLAMYKWAGFGVYGSGVYLDPIGEWAAYLRALPLRLADLLGAQFFALPAELAVAGDALRLPLTTMSVISTLLVVAGAITLWKHCIPEERHLLAWMGLGSFIASLPVLATFPSGRLLLLPSIGGAVWIGLFIVKGLNVVVAARPRILVFLGRTYLLLHLAAMPFYWLGVSLALPALLHVANEAFHEIEIDAETIADERVFTLFAPDPYSGLYPLVVRTFHHYPRPRGWQTLSLAPYDHAVTRTGPNSFVLEIVGGDLLSTPFERLIRSPEFPFKAEDVVSMGGYDITVLETGAHGPSRISVDCTNPLEHPGYRFLAWQGGQLRTVDWPDVGERRLFKASEGYFGWPYFKKRLALL